MKKILGLVLTVACAFTLTACGDNSETVNGTDYYNDSYSVHYTTLNYLTTSDASNLEVFANLVEGLVDTNQYGQVVGVGATSWTDEITDAGEQVWTFNLNPDVHWYTNDTREDMGAVTAQDYVSSLEYVLNPNNASETSYIIQMFIKGAAEYAASFDGVNPGLDFSTVGVKAIDDYTLEYTLPTVKSYFPTALSYSCFMPVNKDFLKDQGMDFGLTADNLLVNGPYTLTTDVKDSKLEITANPDYPYADDVAIKTYTWTFIPSDAGYDWARLKYENGELSGFTVVEQDTSGYEKYVTGEDGTGTEENPVDPRVYSATTTSPYSYGYMINPYRSYSHDPAVAYQNNEQDEATRANTATAMQNANFRLAFQYGIDREKFNAYYTPSNPSAHTRNIFMPSELAYDQNGKDYIEYLYETMAAETGITAEEASVALADGVDYWYQPELAVEYMEKAKAELGDTVTWPVNVETFFSDSAATYIYNKSMVDQMQVDLGDYIDVTVLDIASHTEWLNTLFAGSFDFYGVVAWGPDYADPQTYGEVFQDDVQAFSVYLGLDLDYIAANPESQAKYDAILGEYSDMIRYAETFVAVEDTDERYAAFADAEWYLFTEVGVWAPAMSLNGDALAVSNVIPKSMPTVSYGSNKYHYKYLRCIEGNMTTDLRAQYLEEFEATKAALAE